MVLPISENRRFIMNIKIESPVNKYYVQTLCMIFFPGEKFSENVEESDDLTRPLFI